MVFGSVWRGVRRTFRTATFFVAPPPGFASCWCYVAAAWPSTHRVLKWPLLIIFAVILTNLLIAYICIRWTVKALEWAFSDGRAQQLKHSLREANNRKDYGRLARKLDRATGRERWKVKEQSSLYDHNLVRNRLKTLQFARETNNAAQVLSCLRQVCHVNFANIESEHLYAKTYDGTKYMIEDFVDEVCRCIRYLQESVCCVADADRRLVISVDQFVRKAEATWGCTALCLSGGAAIGMHHFGVVKALLEDNSLPQVICGASAGAVVGGFVCTRTDEELRECLTPEHVCSTFRCFQPSSWVARAKNFLRTGFMFDGAFWLERLRDIYGDTTFKEAFDRTGRILNIAISRKGSGGKPLVVNMRNAPNVTIASAIRCSAAFPSLIPAQQLWEKHPDGTVAPGSFEFEFFQDGSIDADIPTTDLSETWGVKYSIVVQVNPHVFPWIAFQSRGSAGLPIAWRKGSGRWRGGFILSALEVFVKEQMRLMCRLAGMLELLPRFFATNWAKVTMQDYHGSLLLTPRRIFFIHLWRIVDDLPLEELRWFFREGEHMAYPKMSAIRNHMRVEKELEELNYAVMYAKYSGAGGGTSAHSQPGRGVTGRASDCQSTGSRLSATSVLTPLRHLQQQQQQQQGGAGGGKSKERGGLYNGERERSGGTQKISTRASAGGANEMTNAGSAHGGPVTANGGMMSIAPLLPARQRVSRSRVSIDGATGGNAGCPPGEAAEGSFESLSDDVVEEAPFTDAALLAREGVDLERDLWGEADGTGRTNGTPGGGGGAHLPPRGQVSDDALNGERDPPSVLGERLSGGSVEAGSPVPLSHLNYRALWLARGGKRKGTPLVLGRREANAPSELGFQDSGGGVGQGGEAGEGQQGESELVEGRAE